MFKNFLSKFLKCKSRDFVENQLQSLGYFKYAKPENLELVLAETFKNYKNDGEINFPSNGLNRIFSMDAEFLFEGDGILDQINGMLMLFQDIGINLQVDNYIEFFDNDLSVYTKRTIELNGKIYDVSSVSDWGTAFNSGVKLIDKVLNDFGFSDRIFGLHVDESSTMILLEDTQFKFLSSIIPGKSIYKPIDIRELGNF